MLAASDPLQVVSTSPELDQGTIAPISSLEVTFNAAIDESTLDTNDIGVLCRNALATGAADVSYAYGAAGAGWRPLVGCWTSDPQAVDAALEQLDLAELDASALTDSLDMPLG